MKNKSVITILFVLTATSACGRKKQETIEFVPPGTYTTRAEAQSFADRQNANMASVRTDEKSKGVSDEALPCGKYVVFSIRNSDGREFWGTRQDKTGCPDQIPAFNFPTQPQTKGGTKP
jgi:hypothetical protein